MRAVLSDRAWAYPAAEERARLGLEARKLWYPD
jgi:hypothetical protein